MKKFLKITGVFILSIIILLYLAFLIIPPVINFTSKLDNYKPDVQKLVKQYTKLNLDYSKIKLYSTPMLSIGAIIENIEVKLDDNSTLFSSPKIKAGLALPSLLTLTVKTAKCSIDSPYINLEIANGEQYKVVKIIEDIINENNAKPKEPKTTEEANIPNITIKVPSIVINNYLAQVVDLKTAHKLSLKGEKMVLGYNSRSNTFKFATKADLLSDESENIKADVKLLATLPKGEKTQEEVDPEEKISIPFVNPVTIYQTYDLKADVVSRLRFNNVDEHGIVARGFLNVDNLSLKLSDIRLPESYLHSRFHGKKVEYESNIYAKSDEKITLLGFLKYGKHPKMKTQIISDKIHFANLLDLSKGLLDSLNIKNNLASIKADGYLEANTLIKTNFKKLKSQGSITIQDGAFVNSSTGIGIKDLVANFIFDDNKMDIKETKALINNSKLALVGFIDSKSNVDIKLDVDNLSLPPLYSAFAPKELKNQLLLNSANLTAHADIEGKLEELSAQLTTKLANLSLSDSKKTMFVENNSVDIALSANNTAFRGDIINNGFNFSMPQINTKVLVDKLNIELDSDKITVNPFDLVYNNLSKINIYGDVSNYQKDPKIDFLASGALTTENLKQTLGSDLAYYFNSKGSIPAKVSIKGDTKKQDIIAQIYSDSNNFITPINLTSLVNNPSLINLGVNIKGNKIKIKDSGLYKKAQNGFSDNLESNMAGAAQLVELTSTIEGNHINLFRLNIPRSLSGSIAKFNKSQFSTKGKIVLNGKFDNINYDGDLKINDISIPELLIKLQNLDLNLASHNLTLALKELDLNGSKLDASLKADLKPAKVFRIYDINVLSNLVDVDKTMLILNELTKYMPPASPKPQSKTNTASADIPLSADGKFNIKQIKTGAIRIDDARGNIALKNNDLIIDRLNCKAFEGNILGNIKMNLISSLLTIKVRGNKINADKMLTDAANMKGMISGVTRFTTDISLSGSTLEEQMKSLKGNVKFNIKDGVYGPFSKLENFFLAENIRENPVFKNTIGIILTPLTTIDSSHFENLNGSLDFNNGIVKLNPITSQGDVLCVLIKGNMDLLKNNIDSKVRVRLASTVSDMLGPLSMANPVNLVKNTPGLNIATAKLFSIFTYVVEPSEYKEIPDFSAKHSDNNATKFQIVLSGDVAKPLKLVKSFKWLALQEDMDKAKEFSDKYVQEQEDLAKQALIDKLQSEYEQNNKLKVGVEKVLGMDTTAPAVKELVLEEVLKSKQNVEQKIEDNVQAVEDKKEAVKEDIKNQVTERLEAQKAQQEKLKEDFETKVQNAVEKNKELQQQKLEEGQKKLNSLNDKIKNKLKENIPPSSQIQQTQTNESAEVNNTAAIKAQ